MHDISVGKNVYVPMLITIVMSVRCPSVRSFVCLSFRRRHSPFAFQSQSINCGRLLNDIFFSLSICIKRAHSISCVDVRARRYPVASKQAEKLKYATFTYFYLFSASFGFGSSRSVVAGGPWSMRKWQNKHSINFISFFTLRHYDCRLL